jgi:catechol 2,3-dioxygenase-like lactoylglutathione lyase family enzyme
MKTNLTHVKVMVPDLEKTLRWYTEVLGLEIDSCYPETNPVYYDFKTDGGDCFAIGLDENATPNGRFNFQTENTDELW